MYTRRCFQCPLGRSAFAPFGSLTGPPGFSKTSSTPSIPLGSPCCLPQEMMNLTGFPGCPFSHSAPNDSHPPKENLMVAAAADQSSHCLCLLALLAAKS